LIGTLTVFNGRAAAQDPVRVTAADAAVYLRPDSTSPVILEITVGTLLDVARQEGDWYPVVLPPDAQGLRRFGYVAARAVERVVRTPEQRPGADMPTPSQAPVGQAPPLPGPLDPGSPTPETAWAREGAFVSVSVPFHRLHVNREEILTNLGDFLLVPSFSDNRGLSVSVGHQSVTRSIELTYARSTHSSSATFVVPGVRRSLLVFEGESLYNRINVDYKQFLTRRSRAQPYLLAGVGFPWLRVTERGLVSGSVVDAKFSGIGGDAGGGLSFFVHRRIAAHLGVAYRYDLFLSARGGERDWINIKDLVSVRGVQVSSGVSFAF